MAWPGRWYLPGAGAGRALGASSRNRARRLLEGWCPSADEAEAPGKGQSRGSL